MPQPPALGGFGGPAATRRNWVICLICEICRQTNLLDKCQQEASIAPMSRWRHPDQHIERAIQYAESLGWRVVSSNGHAWGRLLCPHSTREGCIISV